MVVVFDVFTSRVDLITVITQIGNLPSGSSFNAFDLHSSEISVPQSARYYPNSARYSEPEKMSGSMAESSGAQSGPSRIPFDPDSPLFVAQATLASGPSPSSYTSLVME